MNTMRVSIHAPLAECDQRYKQVQGRCIWFQSTHPSRSATFEIFEDAGYSAVSIHAPLAECDVQGMFRSQLHRWFQSTHPSRSATLAKIKTIDFMHDSQLMRGGQFLNTYLYIVSIYSFYCIS